jgi:Leucine-rich repeat (LRR) protein
MGSQLGPSELKHLTISNVQWTPENLTALGMGLSRNATLEVLDLSFKHREGGITLSLRPLAEGLRHATSLRLLKVEVCWLDDTQLADLTRGLRDKPSLLELYLLGNKCRSQGMLQLAALLQSPQSQLHTIDLSFQFDVDSDQDSDHDPPALLEHTSLDIAPLSAALHTNQTLERLDLSYNKLTDSDMTVFAHSLRDNTGLQQLNLDDNSFGPEGAKALLELMKSNSVIEWIKISVDYGEEMEELQAKITFLANWNRGGRRILSQNNVRRSLWSLIVERINTIEWGKEGSNRDDRRNMLSTEDGETERASVLFCLLREAPALFERSICESQHGTGETSRKTLRNAGKMNAS